MYQNIIILLPHEGDWMDGNTVKEEWHLNNPLSAVRGESFQSNFHYLASMPITSWLML
jgi:alpha-mannosidase